MAKRNPEPAPSPAAKSPVAPCRRRYWLAAAALLLAVLLTTAGFWWHSQRPAPPVTPLKLVDEAQCAGCHQAQHASWQQSHHHLAMQAATTDTVKGDFSGTVFRDQNGSSRFFRQDGKFFVETPGADGQAQTFEVTHTFGVAPLQQYLLAFPGGRLQAFTTVWDTEKKKWFSLHAGEKIGSQDELHWTKPAQNWNFMCAECHATGLKRGYDSASDSYNTSWHALGVGCQSCHGPASGHLAWAEKHKTKDSQGSGFESALPLNDSTKVIETCGRCHSRRAPLGDGFVQNHRLADDYQINLLTEDRYHTDGKIKDEVFEYASFLQSPMFMKGLNCADCHDPHSGQTRLPGNALCTSCHNASTPAARPGIDTSTLKKKNYDSIEHHHHQPGTPGSACIDCHMPGKVYMGNDFRHDHSFSIPRPDLSRELASPDACQQCHEARGSSWSTEKLKAWHGEKERPMTFGQFMKVLRRGEDNAGPLLLQMSMDKHFPPIQRATALLEAGRYPGLAAQKSLQAGLVDSDPLLRQSALQGLGAFPIEQQISLAAPLLRDPVRAVRMAAAWQLNAASTQLGPYQQDWQAAIQEYESSQAALAERPEAHANMAELYRQRGQTAEAWQAMEQALRLNPDFSAMLIMKSEMLGAQGDHSAAEALLRAAIARRPRAAELQHALGLAYVRAGQLSSALPALKRATELAPQASSYGYVYAVALHDSGKRAQALQQLESVLKEDGSNRDAWLAAIRYRQEAGDSAGALAMAQRLWQINPDDPALRRTTP